MSALTLRWHGPLGADPGLACRRLLARPEREGEPIAPAVAGILAEIRRSGDPALFDLTERFDRVRLRELEVPRGAWDRAVDELDPAVRRALERAADNLARAHRAWLPVATVVETEAGVRLERRPFPLARVGVYAPGGRAAYPSSVLMGVVPARVAGVGEIVVCSPPGPMGMPSGVVLAAAAIGGAHRVFALGGAQAIGAMAYGTASVPRVDRIVGPGNAYVTAAKLQVADRVGIDSPAGPSEVLVIADRTTDPALVAAELVAQAEHDADAVTVAVVVGPREALEPFERALADAVETAPRAAVVRSALAGGGALVPVADLEQAIQFAEEFAAEHLLLASAAAAAAWERFRVAGAVFVGAASSVAFGDYLTGGNHVLPTGGAALGFSGLSTGDFVRWTCYQALTPAAAAALAGDTAVLASAEGLPGHAAAALRRQPNPTETRAGPPASWEGR